MAAVGGKDALAKIKSRIAIGTVKKENDTGIKMAIMSEAPNRVTAVYVFERYDWQLTYDGSKAFVRPLFPRALTSVQDKYEEMLSSGLMFNSISLYNLLTAGEASGAKFEAKGTKKVRDRLAYVVEMKRPQGGTARLFFDTETFMWVRTEFGKVGFSKPLQQFLGILPVGDPQNDDFGPANSVVRRPRRDPLEGELLFPIYLPPMANLDDLNGSPFVIDRIYDAVVSLADTISFLTGDLFVVVRAWIPGQCSDPIHDATQILFRQSTQLTLR